MARAAMVVYDKIYADHKVYLLAALITEREQLGLEVTAASTLEEVREIIKRLESKHILC